jgi:hypothetical protein
MTITSLILASSLLTQVPQGPPRQRDGSEGHAPQDHGTPPRPPGSPAQSLLALSEYLQLSREQIEQIHANLQQHLDGLGRKRNAVHLAQLVMEEALRDPSTTEARLQELNGRAAAARFEEAVEALGLLKESVAVLSPEQAGRFRAALPVLKALEGKPHSPRPGGPPPRPGEGSSERLARRPQAPPQPFQE